MRVDPFGVIQRFNGEPKENHAAVGFPAQNTLQKGVRLWEQSHCLPQHDGEPQNRVFPFGFSLQPTNSDLLWSGFVREGCPPQALLPLFGAQVWVACLREESGIRCSDQARCTCVKHGGLCNFSSNAAPKRAPVERGTLNRATLLQGTGCASLPRALSPNSARLLVLIPSTQSQATQGVQPFSAWS